MDGLTYPHKDWELYHRLYGATRIGNASRCVYRPACLNRGQPASVRADLEVVPNPKDKMVEL